MTRRLIDDDGHAWPVTGCRCPVCSMPADPVLDGEPHPGCLPEREATAAEVDDAVQLLAQALGAEVIGRYTTRWLVSGAPLPTTPDTSTVAVPPEHRICSDCRYPLPDTAGIGVTCHVSCWQARHPAPGTWPATTASRPTRATLPAIQPATEPTATDLPSRPPCSACAQPLLLTRPGRTICERCRLAGTDAP